MSRVGVITTSTGRSHGAVGITCSTSSSLSNSQIGARAKPSTRSYQPPPRPSRSPCGDAARPGTDHQVRLGDGGGGQRRSGRFDDPGSSRPEGVRSRVVRPGRFRPPAAVLLGQHRQQDSAVQSRQPGDQRQASRVPRRRTGRGQPSSAVRRPVGSGDARFEPDHQRAAGRPDGRRGAAARPCAGGVWPRSPPSRPGPASAHRSEPYRRGRPPCRAGRPRDVTRDTVHERRMV